MCLFGTLSAHITKMEDHSISFNNTIIMTSLKAMACGYRPVPVQLWYRFFSSSLANGEGLNVTLMTPHMTASYNHNH